MTIQKIKKGNYSHRNIVVPRNLVTADVVNSVIDNINAVKGYSCVKTVRKTIGGVAVQGCDHNFATAANATEQVINLGVVVPVFARLVDVFLVTDMTFAGATTLVADVGTTSGGGELIASATIYAKNAVLAAANAAAMQAAPNASGITIYVNATPGANWSNVTEGKVSVYVTYIDISDL